jgi:hypothetical protein
MGHVTGCRTVYNHTSQDFLIVKGEWPSTTLFIEKKRNRSFRGESFPWCERSEEVRDKAFRFFRGATSGGGGEGAFYMFQDRDGAICWTAFNGGNPSYDARKKLIFADQVNVSIQEDGTPTVEVS